MYRGLPGCEDMCAECCVLCCICLSCRAGQVGEALALMQEATQNMTLDGTSAAQMVTMGYNLARLQEASGRSGTPTTAGLVLISCPHMLYLFVCSDWY